MSEHEELSELLASLALDALEPEDEERLADHPELEDELAALRDVAAWLGAAAAVPAPVDLRERLLAGVEDRNVHVAATSAGLPDAPDALAGQIDDFRALLVTLDPRDWAVPTRAGLTVHELVGHLIAVERYTASLLGAGSFAVPEGTEFDHLGMSRPTIDHELGRAPAETAAAWDHGASVVVDAARAADLTSRVSFHGLDVSVKSLCLMRTFELWVHADDIRQALGRPAPATDPGRLHVMADLAVQSLPLGMLLAGFSPSDVTVRVVLTGASGGVWMQPLGSAPASDEAATVLVTDVEDFCRLVGQRMEADELPVDIRGDRDLAHRVLVGARVFAA